MMGMVRQKLLAMAALAMMTLASFEAKAFCIYNYSSWPINFEQKTSGFFTRGMKTTIPAGGNACCNWKDSGCNPGGKRTSTVYFHHSVANPPNNTVHNYRCNPSWSPLEMQAGGWAEIYDNPDSRWGINCVTYPAN